MSVANVTQILPVPTDVLEARDAIIGVPSGTEPTAPVLGDALVQVEGGILMSSSVNAGIVSYGQKVIERPELPKGAGREQSGEHEELYREILENAFAATDAKLVALDRYDPDIQHVFVLMWSGREGSVIHSGLSVLRRIVPQFDSSALSHPAGINKHIERVLVRGEVAHGPFLQLTRGTMPGPVLRMANTLVGLRYSLFCPLIVRGRVLGALSFHGPAPFPVHIQRVCLAFARQAALALDNAHLLETLREQVDELKLSRERIVISDERLRKEIAELLHGRVQNQLLVAWHRVGQAMEAMKTSPEEVRRLLSEARDGIDAVREQDVRRASHLLHPAIIRVGLLPAIRSLAGQLGSTGPAIAVNVDPRVQTLDDPEVGHIPESTRLAAYRVTEEALNNVYRHAKARHVEITLQLDERDRLELEIRDDGEGFNRDHMKPGLGLGNIAARLGQVGGTWSIYSSLGRGTTLLARIPIATN